jgi:arabinose-5-phosphate isomerase
MTVMDMRGFGRDGMRVLHPGGAIGMRLAPMSQLMHGAAYLPLVSPETPMCDVVSVMTCKGFGVAGVVNADGNLIGIITDGDLRRHFNVLQTTTAHDVMNDNPRTLTDDILAEQAVEYLNEEKITCAFIVPDGAASGCQKPIGIIHLHDFLRLGLY